VARQSLASAGHVTESGVRRRADDPSRHLEEPAQQEAGKFRGQFVLSLQTVAEKVQAFSLISRLVLLHISGLGKKLIVAPVCLSGPSHRFETGEVIEGVRGFF
jgi:hypothetical protein